MLVERAFLLALRAHDGQVRKHDGSPYIAHPVSVALVLSRHGFAEEVVAAGLVHDVLEDTAVSAAALRQALGEDVHAIVSSLTEDKALPWENRKAQYLKTIRTAPLEVKAVSAADKLHNLSNTLEEHARIGDLLWERFSRGKEAQREFYTEHLRACREGQDHPLFLEYEEVVQKFLAL